VASIVTGLPERSPLIQRLSRRTFIQLAGGAAVTTVVSACASAATASPPPVATPAAAASTTPPPSVVPSAPTYTIPTGSVRFGVNAACPDCNMPNVALQKKFFDDAGLTINAVQIPTFNNILPAMQRGDHDIAGYYIQGYFQTLNTFGMDLPPSLFYDIFLGHGILKAPTSTKKSTQDFLDQGMSFADAAKAAIAQLRGAQVASPSEMTVQPDEPSIWFSYAGMTVKDVGFFILQDEKIAELAAAGRVELAFPASAAITVQLLNNGWTPLIDDRIILEKDTGPNRTKIVQLVGSTGMFHQRKWGEQNWETLLRFISVIFRTIDYVFDPATQPGATQIIADIVNANQGTTLKPTDIVGIYKNLDPFWPWDYQTEVWENSSNPYYIPTAVQAQVQSLIATGTLPNQSYDLTKFLVAGDIYRDLKSRQKAADGLMAQASAVTDPARKALVDQAKQQYAWHNYVDAVGYLKAALA